MYGLERRDEQVKRKKNGSSLSRRRANLGYLFILPLIIGVVFVFIPNLVQTFRFSLNDIQLGTEKYTLSPVGWEYFQQALTKDAQFIRYLVASLGDFFTRVPVVLIFSLFIASILNTKFRGRGLARMIFFIPVILATGIVASVEKTSGIIGIMETDRTLVTGLEDQSVEVSRLLTSINLPDALIGVIESAIEGIYTIVQSSGMQIFIFLAGLQEIPGSLYDAAQVEGCNRWELFWKITFPMISPQIVVCTVYTIIDLYSSVDSDLIVYVNSLAYSQNMFGLATAMYVLYLLCLAVLVGIVLAVLSRFSRISEGGR